jgi:sarcosine oxidase subunit alpha
VSAQPFRLFAGGRIDRDRPLQFTFNGVAYTGFAGDTLASALLANGVHLVGRSFKYHRPRGIFSDGAEEPNALVQLEVGAYTQPNLRATQVELYDGLAATSQNCWPNVETDIGAVAGMFARILPAGFYYKTFMWPPGWWMRYERLIRRAAGLGRAPAEPDPDLYEKMHAHCDVLVVGAGPAGLAAAQAAARAGARVIIADERPELGGSLLGRRVKIDDAPALDWVGAVTDELDAAPEVRVLTRSTVTGYYDHNYLTLVERVTDHLGPGARPGVPRQRLWKLRAGQVVLASGAHERPLVFRDNDRPGVMLAGAAQSYVNRYAVRPGDEAVVFTNNDSAYEAALDLSDAGARVTLVDARAAPPEDLRAAPGARGIELLAGHAVASALGGARVRGCYVAPLDAAGAGYAGPVRQLACDLLCVSGGWSPVVHLFSQSRGRLAYDSARACFVPSESVQAERSVGAANGAFDLAYALSEGREAGKAAAAATGHRTRSRASASKVHARESTPIRALWLVPPRPADRPASKSFVDLQNDVTAADLALAVREGYRSIEHLKRYTTTGMGTDQGKTGNVNALGIVAGLEGVGIENLGVTTFRPPYTPVTFGVLAGRDVGALMDPVRRTPMHHWHEAQGARWEDVGQWRRPWYYPRPGESLQAAVDRECLAVRNAVGIMDASTLGMIDICGPDAAELLERVYTNGWRGLGVGRCRYGLMCGEDGMVFDDGVTTRVAEDRFLMTTTTGNAARVLTWLEEWLQTEWPTLRVYCCSVTEQWAVATVAGPLAREVLGELTGGVDISPAAFPFMVMREGTVAGIPARVGRISFTGELSYEIAVPADYGLSLWLALTQAGERFGLTPFGTETMHVLRAEKGYIIAGQDTDGTVTPVDLGMHAMVSERKDFIGKRSLSRPELTRPDRKQLVGLRTKVPDEVLPEGAQIVETARPRIPERMVGHVTSSYSSAALGHSIALALVRGGRSRLGETVWVPLEGKVIEAAIVPPVFYDPEGGRLRG